MQGCMQGAWCTEHVPIAFISLHLKPGASLWSFSTWAQRQANRDKSTQLFYNSSITANILSTFASNNRLHHFPTTEREKIISLPLFFHTLSMLSQGCWRWGGLAFILAAYEPYLAHMIIWVVANSSIHKDCLEKNDTWENKALYGSSISWPGRSYLWALLVQQSDMEGDCFTSFLLFNYLNSLHSIVDQLSQSVSPKTGITSQESIP